MSIVSKSEYREYSHLRKLERAIRKEARELGYTGMVFGDCPPATYGEQFDAIDLFVRIPKQLIAGYREIAWDMCRSIVQGDRS